MLCVWSSVQNLSLKFLVNQEFLEILGLGRGFHLFGDNSTLGHLPSWTAEFYWEGEGRDSFEWKPFLEKAWCSSSQLPELLKQKKWLCFHFLMVPVVCASFTGLFHIQPALAKKPVSFPFMNLKSLCRSQHFVCSWKSCNFLISHLLLSQCYISAPWYKSTPCCCR